MDIMLLFCRLDAYELQEVVADVAQVCAAHVSFKWYEDCGADIPLFCETFKSSYESTLEHCDKLDLSDEEIPF